LQGFSNLLVGNAYKYTPEKVQQLAQEMNDTSQNAYTLLKNLLEWSRLQTGKLIPNPAKVTPSELIFEAQFMCEPAAKSKSIELHTATDCDEYILADKEMIKTVLRNLLTNAMKFTNQNGVVKIQTQQIDDMVLFVVSDTGIGIEAEHIDNLFKIDCKLSKEGTAGETGTGLGLILCKEFVEKNGGRIWVESDLGKGSEFMFTLPIAIT